MTRFRQELDQLAAATSWTYRASRESAAEAAAWSAVALAGYGDLAAAHDPADWLVGIQQGDGSVGVFAAEAEPRWPTSLALLAWCVLDRDGVSQRYTARIDRAAGWSLANRGLPAPRSPQIGHDTTIVGWSWAADTASWLEPTCYHVIALTAAGFGDHARIREGRRLIADRLLPGGGANYGNTIVLGQALLPHVAPTGAALVALAGHSERDQRVERSIDYLEKAVGPNATPQSLSWACLGLTAHRRRPRQADEWIDAAFRDHRWRPLPAYERALLLLAARPELDWMPTSAIPAIAEAER